MRIWAGKAPGVLMICQEEEPASEGYIIKDGIEPTQSNFSLLLIISQSPSLGEIFFLDSSFSLLVMRHGKHGLVEFVYIFRLYIYTISFLTIPSPFGPYHLGLSSSQTRHYIGIIYTVYSDTSVDCRTRVNSITTRCSFVIVPN